MAIKVCFIPASEFIFTRAACIGEYIVVMSGSAFSESNSR